MAYPPDTGSVLQWMYPDINPETDWSLRIDDGQVVLDWYLIEPPKPTDGDIEAAKMSMQLGGMVEWTRRKGREKANGEVHNSDYIRGYRLEWMSGSGQAIRATGGECRIGGKVVADSDNIYTLTGDDVALDKFAGQPESFYYVYLCESGSERALHLARRRGIGDDPQRMFPWSLGHKGSINLSPPEEYRLLGYFLTRTDGTVIEFGYSGDGNDREFSIAYGGKTVSRFLSAPVEVPNEWRYVDVSSLFPINATHLALSGYLINSTQAAITDARCGFSGFKPAGNPASAVSVGAEVDLQPGKTLSIGRVLVPNTDRRVWYAAFSADPELRIHAAGARITV